MNYDTGPLPRPWKQAAPANTRKQPGEKWEARSGLSASLLTLITQSGILQSVLPARPGLEWKALPSADCGWFFCVPTATEWMGLLMSFDTNGTVRQCDYGFSPHAAQTWQEMTRVSAPFRPPKNSVETIFSSQLELSPTHPLSVQFPLPSIILQVAENKVLRPDVWWVG